MKKKSRRIFWADFFRETVNGIAELDKQNSFVCLRMYVLYKIKWEMSDLFEVWIVDL